MKPLILFAFAAIILASFINKSFDNSSKNSTEARNAELNYKTRFAVGCQPDLTQFDFADSANFIPLLSGWGNYRMPVTVTDDSANMYFQQGINMFYGFHVIEALASFEKAIHFDKNFAMAYWGKALAYGPNINDFEYNTTPEAMEAVKQAIALSTNCTPLEKALIEAQQVRYSSDTTETRAHLNQLYADAMKQVHQKFPESPDAASNYADALMLQHPWDLYDRNYKPKTWTPAIVEVLYKLVHQFPGHPGANHLYIHAIEGSEHPEKGLEVANRLGALMPGVAHLVHMPSHIYIRSGYYKEGVDVNVNAVKGFEDYASKFPAVNNNIFLYLMHNLHMEASCANMDARYKDALRISNEAASSFDTAFLSLPGLYGVFSQNVYMTPFLTQIRFGKWDEILQQPEIPERFVYAHSLWHYGRGLAFARKHQFEEAQKELISFRKNFDNPQLHDHPPAFNPGIAPLHVAEKLLQGVMAQEQGKISYSTDLFKEAIILEDGMLYNEPRDWPHPARQYLGNALLVNERYAEAEKIFREDLEINPNNGWSLTGLSNALSLQGKKREAAGINAQAKKALERTDVQITASVF